MTSVSAIPANPTTPRVGSVGVSYGVELEFIFAFHEDDLLLEIGKDTRGVTYTIEKALSYFDREHPKFSPMALTSVPNRVYNSWGLSYIHPLTDRKITIPYTAEPMNIIGRNLRKKHPGFKFKTRSIPTEEGKTKDKYGEWTITSDPSVCGVGSASIPSWLGRDKMDIAHNWDSYGVEFVSRVLDSDSVEDRQEIAVVLDAVKGDENDRYGAFVTNQCVLPRCEGAGVCANATLRCGLHVHVETPQELPTLQELALILIVYEEEISRLHAPCRRPSHAAARSLLESNRMSIMHHPPDLDTKYFHTSTAALERAYNGPIEIVRQELRALPDKEALAKYMNGPVTRKYPQGNKNRQVNFVSAARPENFPATIEFRQARGSLCLEEISRWVDFCIGLVKLAALYREDPARFPVKGLGEYVDENNTVQKGRISVFDLMKDMGLETQAIRYWESRMAKYSMGTRGDADDRTDNELPPPEPDISDSEAGDDDHR
jgi:hypothetical protein